MKRVLVLTLNLMVLSPVLAMAQTAMPDTPSLADVARAEEARRKTAKKAVRVITNSSLGEVPASTASSSPAGTSHGGASGGVSGQPGAGAQRLEVPEDEQPADTGAKQDEKQWRERMAAARSDLSRTQLYAESMQSRINALKNDVFNLDYPARGVAEKQLNASTAELEKLKKDVEAKTKAIAAIQEEARRAGVPAGWVR
jgi:hypothetical protein